MTLIEIVDLEVYCLSKPNFSLETFESFLKSYGLDWIKSHDASDAEHLIEAAGRVCYMSFGKKRQSPKNTSEYIQNLITQGHESVLEHISWSFLLTGVSRAFTHQLVRHRVGFSYSQLSQQYHDESDAKFVAPPSIKSNPNLISQWKESIEESVGIYKKLISEISNDESMCESTKKEKLRDLRSASRSVLPNATETKIVVTANARALRHFFSMRGALDGDSEMRQVSCAIFDIVSKDAPACFQDFRLINMPDGSPKLILTE